MDRRGTCARQWQGDPDSRITGWTWSGTASRWTASRSAAQERRYILLYKPKGYITSYGDPEGRRNSVRSDRELGAWVVPVGRLDQDTSGLLLMTNDTQFAERIMNPEFKIPRRTW